MGGQHLHSCWESHHSTHYNTQLLEYQGSKGGQGNDTATKWKGVGNDMLGGEHQAGAIDWNKDDHLPRPSGACRAGPGEAIPCPGGPRY